MKSIIMKGKNTEEAIKAALAVLGINSEQAEVKVIKEGKPAVMGIIGGEEAEVEVSLKKPTGEESRQVLQDILDKMGLLAVVDLNKDESENIVLVVKGEDMGRIIGKEGTMLKALEILVNAITWKATGEKIHASIDAGGYREKRITAIQRLANDAADDVIRSGEEKILPYMEAADRRIIHLYLKENANVTTLSRGEGRERRIVISPKK